MIIFRKAILIIHGFTGKLYDEQNIFDKALEDYRMVIKTNPKY